MQNKMRKKIRLNISLWIIVSATLVVVAIQGMMIFMQYQQRKDEAVLVFVEKGATLIRSFEAGWRGRLLQKEELFYLQKLLMETSQQPDIDYLMVTDARGNILADSDPSMLGRSYGLDLEPDKIAASREIRWRQSANPEGAGTFEVYRGFANGPDNALNQNLIVYVGFNMDKIEKASREDTFQTVMMALVLILIGSLAIISLFLVQAYRLAHSSLSRLTVFSDALIKNMPIALVAVDRAGEVIAWNTSARPLFVDGPSDAKSRQASSLLHPPFGEVLQKVDPRAELVEEEVEIPSADGSNSIWEVFATAFADREVREGKILLARNVTALRQMEREVVRSRHLNAIGSLAAGVAHEIRNPLSSIKGFAVYFKQKLAGSAEDAEVADIMIAETDRLNRVISQLIEFARPLQLKKEAVHPLDLVRQTLKLVEVQAQKLGVALNFCPPDHLPEVTVDPDKIKQVLLNLFLNALEAMPAGGRLTINLAAQKDFVDLEITDTGEGIKQEDLPRIYDPYFTSKPAGSGLGLAMVQKIMDAHGDAILVESETGVGTKVTLRFASAAVPGRKA